MDVLSTTLPAVTQLNPFYEWLHSTPYALFFVVVVSQEEN